MDKVMKKICSFVFLSLLVSTCISFAADSCASSPDSLCDSDCDVLSPEMRKRLGKRPRTKEGETDGLELVARRSVTCEATGGATAGAADQESSDGSSDESLEDFLRSLDLGSDPGEQTGNPLASRFAGMQRGVLLTLPSVKEEKPEREGGAGRGAPVTKAYFKPGIPEKEHAKTTLSKLIKDEDQLATSLLHILLEFLISPEEESKGFDFNDFAIRLAACKTAEDQKGLILKEDDKLRGPFSSGDEEEYYADEEGDKFSTTYFTEETPTKERVITVLFHLIKDGDRKSTLSRLETLIESLFTHSPTRLSRNYFNHFAQELDSRETLFGQNEFLGTKEEQLKLWMDQQDAKANITGYKFCFEKEIREKNEAHAALVLLIPRNDLAEGRLKIILDLLYPNDGVFPEKKVLDDIATKLGNSRADPTKENYLLELERQLRGLPDDMD